MTGLHGRTYLSSTALSLFEKARATTQLNKRKITFFCILTKRKKRKKKRTYGFSQLFSSDFSQQFYILWLFIVYLYHCHPEKVV